MRIVVGVCLAGPVAGPARADELPPKVREAVDKGLKWFANTQNRDGHWEANGGQYPTHHDRPWPAWPCSWKAAPSARASTRDNIRRAVDWLMARSQPNGLLGNPNIPGEAGRYMYGHGFAMLFLSCVYGEEEDGDRRKQARRRS